MSARRLGPIDSLFLYLEAPTTMMHVAGLLPFTPPADASPTFTRDLVDDMVRNVAVQSPWNLKLRHPRLRYSPLNSWTVDKSFDLDYHVRRSALVAPGDERELGILISRLHSNPIDLSRPPWEFHVIEGLEGGRIALYVKIHHSLVDGFTANKMLQRALSPDPDEMTEHPFFGMVTPQREVPGMTGRPNTLRIPGLPPLGVPSLDDVLNSTMRGAESAYDLGKAVVNTQLRRDGAHADLVSSMQAPRTILNGPVSRNRRFATQQYSLTDLKAAGERHGATLNDVMMSVIGGGLRRFLDEAGDLPEKPLIAFMPVNVRPKDDVGGGNAIGAVLASMGTDVADPLQRLEAVRASTAQAKAQLEGMSQEAILAYSASVLAPMLHQMGAAVTGVRSPLPLTFNVCVSNVPGPQEPLYLRGARLEATYPVSIPLHGMALNITLQSYVDKINVGFIGCRDAVPHLQRLAVYTGEAVEELLAATPPKRAAAAKKAGTPTKPAAPPKASAARKSSATRKAATKKTGSKTSR